MGFFIAIWYIITTVQIFLGYGTAYRLTKNGGDNGIMLFIWLLVMSIAALVPVLGFVLWYTIRDADGYSSSAGSVSDNGRSYQQTRRPSWMPPEKKTHSSSLSNKQSGKAWKNPYSEL